MDNETTEINNINTRYESFRLPSSYQEKSLLESISERGIETPLYGIKENDIFILLDGFKRLRAARKLGTNIVPIKELATSEPDGIIELLKISNAKSLHILEQVRLINDLRSTHKMTVRNIAQRLERSVGWVSVRMGIEKELGEKVCDAIFRGNFPVSALYTLRQFKRLNKESQDNIDEFVTAVSGKKIGQRDIETLAKAWFNGNEEMKKQIRSGDLGWTIENISKKSSGDDNKSFSINEARVINDLEILQKYIMRVINMLPYVVSSNAQYKVKITFLVKSILEKEKKLKEVFSKEISGGEND